MPSVNRRFRIVVGDGGLLVRIGYTPIELLEHDEWMLIA